MLASPTTIITIPGATSSGLGPGLRSLMVLLMCCLLTDRAVISAGRAAALHGGSPDDEGLRCPCWLIDDRARQSKPTGCFSLRCRSRRMSGSSRICP